MLAPLRAPKRYCPARPPEPWQTGIAPNQQPIRFERATERPREVVEGGGGKEGKSEADREVTARMLFRVVRGS
jgi:hypothetical protein